MNALPQWTTACPDWERRIVNRQTLIPFSPLYPDEAAAALAVFKSLRIVDVPNKPTFGEACEDWVFDFVAAIFGAYDAETGTRLIVEFFLLISKKNAKSTIAAGIMVTALVRNWRFSAELLILAPSLEVANNSFKPAAEMVRADPVLSVLMHIQDVHRSITHLQTKAVLKVVSATNDVVSGKKAAFVLIDELWEFGKRADADAMFQEATGGLASRPEGFVVYLSTQSDKPPAGVFDAKLAYFRDVRDGKIIDPVSLPVIYEFPAAMIKAKAYEDPANFYITNPNLGRSVRQKWLERKIVEKSKDDGSKRTFLAKHLNVQIGLALSGEAWAGATYWLQASMPLTLQDLFKRCEVCTIGVDGGGLDDLLALAVIGREIGTRNWFAWNMTWVHKKVLELRQTQAPAFLDFQARGELVIVDDMMDAFEELADTCDEVYKSGLLWRIGLDPHGVALIIDELAKKKMIPVDETGENGHLVPVSQGWKMTGAIKAAEVKLESGQLYHAGQTITTYAVGNAKIEPRGNAVIITKQTSGTAKIDPLMAILNAISLMGQNPPAQNQREFKIYFG